MFLNDNYILANELVGKMGINIANVSILKKKLEDGGDETTIVSLANSSFIKSSSGKLPKNIRNGISNHTFTDISNKLPCAYARNEFGFTDKELLSSNIVYGKVTVCGKTMFEFDRDFIKSVKNHVLFTLKKSEMEECYSKGQISGYVQITKTKYLTWYPLYE